MAKTSKKNQGEEPILTMTQVAYDELKKELEHRVNVLRKEIADEIAAARELGDLSENHAYTVAMERKEMNENRILEIEDILAVAKIVEAVKTDMFVNVGETVEIQNHDNKQKRIVTLVGSEESKTANSLEGKISIDSPIGKALSGSRVSDVVDVRLPNNRITKYKVLRLIK